ncbi:MAG: hypothetical protein M1831_005121 [Alyxoria varia]|nr:MAG: hypothetical protein M1831_005121 [Alyxoria varia]
MSCQLFVCQQLLAHDPNNQLSMVTEMYEKHARSKTRPSLDEVFELFGHICESFSKVYVVLDALDEAPNRNEERIILLKQLKRSASNASVIIFSRPLSELESVLKDTRRINVESQDEDIECYMSERLSSCESIQVHFRKDQTLKQRIMDAVVPKARGMFLMVRLYLDSIITKGNRRQIKATLNSLPDGLSAAYNDAMDRIKAQDQDRSSIAFKIIHWIFFAFRPLTASEINHALAVEEDDSDLDPDGIPEDNHLISSCVGMVVVNEQSGTIGFVHFTVQEYLESHGFKNLSKPIENIAQTCLTYLLFDSVSSADPRTLRNRDPMFSGYDILLLRDTKFWSDDDFPLLNYSARHWGDHVRSCRIEASKDVQDKVLLYLSRPRNTFSIKMSVEAPYRFDRLGPLSGSDVAPICVAASFGLTEIDESFAYGCNQHYPDVVDALLQHGVDINCRDRDGWTPLHHAAFLGQEAMVLKLLQNSADVTLIDRNRETPLARAADGGSTAAARILLDHGSPLDTRNNLGQTPAHNAASKNHHGILRILIERGTDLRIKDKWGYNPWYSALELNHEEAADVVKAEMRKLQIPPFDWLAKREAAKMTTVEAD